MGEIHGAEFFWRTCIKIPLASWNKASFHVGAPTTDRINNKRYIRFFWSPISEHYTTLHPWTKRRNNHRRCHPVIVDTCCTGRIRGRRRNKGNTNRILDTTTAMCIIEYDDKLLLVVVLPTRGMIRIKYKQGITLKRKIKGRQTKTRMKCGREKGK